MSDTERLIVTVRRMSADGRAEALVASADRRVVDATLRAVAKLADRPAGGLKELDPWPV